MSGHGGDGARERVAPQSAGRGRQATVAPSTGDQAAPALTATETATGRRLPLGGSMLSLQRSVGNAAVARLVQREGPQDNIARLDELLDRWNTPEGEVIDLLGRMSPTEKRTVIAGYRGRLASALNFSEMRRAVNNLGAELPVKLDWLQQASVATRLIDYGEIQAMVRAAPQAERDMLRNDRWKTFFMQVCTNRTIVTAVIDLDFDLQTQLRWVGGEADARLSLDLAVLRPLLSAATPDERAAVATDAWRPWWVAVTTNQTMAELVDFLFPTSLVKKLEWMAVEGSRLDLVTAKVHAADPAQRLAVYGSAPVRAMMVSLCDDDEMIEFVVTLGGEWAQRREWVRAEGAPLLALARMLVVRTMITHPTLVNFIAAAQGGASRTRSFLRNLEDAPLAELRNSPIPGDVIRDAFGGDAPPLLRALDGEISFGEQNVSNDETLLAGPTTSPFVEMDFGGDRRFDLSYRRDRLEVSVGIRLEAVDDRARELLPAAKTVWSGRILGAWDNKFNLTNGQRTIPLRFLLSLESGSNHVKVHSGEWAWPKLNAGNWFVPDAVNVPHQAEAVSQAPVHEFGHLIGNLDEYNQSAAHYLEITGQVAATDPNAVAETDTAGTTRYTNSLSVMGTGSSILPRHITNIVDWINGNLRPGEPAFSIAP